VGDSVSVELAASLALKSASSAPLYRQMTQPIV